MEKFAGRFDSATVVPSVPSGNSCDGSGDCSCLGRPDLAAAYPAAWAAPKSSTVSKLHHKVCIAAAENAGHRVVRYRIWPFCACAVLF